MKKILHQLIDPYRSISMIGMCKNAGKTTVLNHIIRKMTEAGVTLGLTSIGRDGESTDLVTGTQKPGIYVGEGTLVATASDLVLRNCDITREILETTGISTPMGDVVVFRARSDGAVQLAGPSMTTQLAGLRELLFQFGAQKVLIDGALSRKTLCSRKVTEATVLCTGASYHKNLKEVVRDTAYQCLILKLPVIRNDSVREYAQSLKNFRGTVLFGQEPYNLPPDMSVGDALRSPKAQGTHTVFFGGALTEFLIKPLLMSNLPLHGMTFLVWDSSKILLKQETYEKLVRRGISLQVLDDVNLVAVTVNPFSAYGFHFPKDAFLDAMADAVQLPVIDVMESTE